jgi:hypothetical protein
VSHDFDELLNAINQCNQQIYALATPVKDDNGQEDDSQWQRATQLLDQRGLFLAQLSSIINSLDQQQIESVGQLYESILATDEQHITLVQAEQLKVKNSLRSIKNAEKALPAYKAHDRNS